MSELRMALEGVGLASSASAARGLARALDEDGSGGIDLREFQNVLAHAHGSSAVPGLVRIAVLCHSRVILQLSHSMSCDGMSLRQTGWPGRFTAVALPLTRSM